MNETRMHGKASLNQIPSRAARHRPTRCLKPRAAGAETFSQRGTQSPTRGWQIPGYCAGLPLGVLQPSRPCRWVSSAILLLTPQAGAS